MEMVEEAHADYKQKFTNLFEAARWVEKGKKQKQSEQSSPATLTLKSVEPKVGSETPGRSSSVDQKEEETEERREKEI
eukprot:1110508-Karenia_brevis.AAC.1